MHVAKCGHYAHDCTKPWIEAPRSNRHRVRRTAKPSEAKEAAHEAVIRRALRIMERRLSDRDVALTSPQAVRDYLRLRIASKEWEVFVVLFLDAQHRLIAADEMFRGTLAQTSVYPREVVKAVMA